MPRIVAAIQCKDASFPFNNICHVHAILHKNSIFDPNMERSRIEIHDYQEHQSGLHAMRKMDDCKLIDELEIPLKRFENIKGVTCHAVNKALAPTFPLLLARFQESGQCSFI